MTSYESRSSLNLPFLTQNEGVSPGDVACPLKPGPPVIHRLVCHLKTHREGAGCSHTGLVQSYSLPTAPPKHTLRHKKLTVPWFRHLGACLSLPTLSLYLPEFCPPPSAFQHLSAPNPLLHFPSHLPLASLTIPSPQAPRRLDSPHSPTTPGNTSQNRAWGNPQGDQLKKVFLSLAEACIPGPLPEQESGAWFTASPTHVIIREREREGVNP